MYQTIARLILITWQEYCLRTKKYLSVNTNLVASSLKHIPISTLNMYSRSLEDASKDFRAHELTKSSIGVIDSANVQMGISADSCSGKR